MSKGYGEALALIEAGKQMALTSIKDAKPQRTETKKEKPLDLAQLIAQKRKELAEYEQAIKDLEKMSKKEEKKKDGWDSDKIAMLLLTLMPLNWAVMWLLLK